MPESQAGEYGGGLLRALWPSDPSSIDNALLSLSPVGVVGAVVIDLSLRAARSDYRGVSARAPRAARSGWQAAVDEAWARYCIGLGPAVLASSSAVRGMPAAHASVATCLGQICYGAAAARVMRACILADAARTTAGSGVGDASRGRRAEGTTPAGDGGGDSVHGSAAALLLRRLLPPLRPPLTCHTDDIDRALASIFRAACWWGLDRLDDPRWEALLFKLWRTYMTRCAALQAISATQPPPRSDAGTDLDTFALLVARACDAAPLVDTARLPPLPPGSTRVVGCTCDWNDPRPRYHGSCPCPWPVERRALARVLTDQKATGMITGMLRAWQAGNPCPLGVF